MGTNAPETGPRPPPVDYESLIAERRKDRGDDAARRAEAARLAEIAENLRTLRERAEEYASQTESDP